MWSLPAASKSCSRVRRRGPSIREPSLPTVCVSSVVACMGTSPHDSSSRSSILARRPLLHILGGFASASEAPLRSYACEDARDRDARSVVEHCDDVKLAFTGSRGLHL